MFTAPTLFGMSISNFPRKGWTFSYHLQIKADRLEMSERWMIIRKCVWPREDNPIFTLPLVNSTCRKFDACTFVHRTFSTFHPNPTNPLLYVDDMKMSCVHQKSFQHL